MLKYILILGVIQGLSEFLPISSSGHLAVLENVFFKSLSSKEKLMITVFLHGGTLLSLLVFFLKDIKEIIWGAYKELVSYKKIEDNSRLILWILLSSLITAFIALPVEDKVESISSNSYLIGILFILNGINLIFTYFIRNEKKDLNSLTIKDVVFITLGQCLALFPGISRSGTTIAFGIYSGLKREDSFKFSFYIAIPPILGANVLKLYEFFKMKAYYSVPFVDIGLGVLVAFLFGILAIWIVKKMTIGGRLYLFGIYTIVIGGIVLLWG